MNWIRRHPRQRNVFNAGGKRKRPPITLATSVGKVTKSEADYINYSRKCHCDDCVMFQPSKYHQQLWCMFPVVGTCRFWEAKLLMAD